MHTQGSTGIDRRFDKWSVLLRGALACVLLVSATGCAWTKDFGSKSRAKLESVLERPELNRVKPWERDVLARKDMSWSPDAMRSARGSHIYFSKESSLVGGSAGGGGCGCN